MAAAAEEELFDFEYMTEEELRQLVDSSPGCVNDWDRDEDGTASRPCTQPSTVK